ncbi:MAG: hypothetical protein ACHQO8_12245 [Vicinamibacterales bacterium]
MNEHPTDFELERYANGGLAAADLLRVDDHVAVCAACRSRALQSGHATDRLSSTVAAVRRDLAAPAVIPFPARSAMSAHIRRRGAIYAAVAAVMIFAIITWGTRGKPVSPPPSLVALSSAPAKADTAPDALTSDERAAVNGAIATGQMPRAAALDALASASGPLMGERARTPVFGPVRPAGIVVDAERPTLEWRAAGDRAEYRVAVFDDAFEEVAKSGWQADTSWTIGRPLTRGQAYSWQVTARIAGRETTAPAPPLPEAKFIVASVDDHARLAAMRKRAGDSHEALAVLLARAGLLDEAESELALARAADPQSASVKRLQDSVKALRRQ